MKKVLIIHGFGGKPNGGWRPWLMGELARQDVYACALAMPRPDEPVMAEWVAEIDHAVAMHPDDEVILVGHSLGVPAILRYLERRDGGRRLFGAVFVAGPSRPTAHEKTRAFLDSPFDYGRIRSRLERCVLIYGADDEIVPPTHAEAHARGLHAPVIMVKGVGHFNGSSGCFELPECLEAISDMMK